LLLFCLLKVAAQRRQRRSLPRRLPQPLVLALQPEAPTPVKMS